MKTRNQQTFGKSTYRPVLETLEQRQLLSSSPLSLGQQTNSDGLALVVWGTSGADDIIVSQVNGGIRVSNGYNWTQDAWGSFARVMIVGGEGNDYIRPSGAFNTKLSIWAGGGDDVVVGGNGGDYIEGNAGNDRIWSGGGDDVAFGGDGNDTIYGGSGYDQLVGQAGNDTFVTIGGGTYDRAWGGDGYDSFWTDAESTEGAMDLSSLESQTGADHRVGGFLGYRYAYGGSIYSYTPSRELLGQNMPDPVAANGTTGWQNFSRQPLFSSAGPSPDDVRQGAVGSCWMLATFSAFARGNPNRIRQSIVDLGDGTFAVRFFRAGQPTFVRIDGDLPVNANGSLVYAKLGNGNATWSPLMEKAAAVFRAVGSYSAFANLNGGWLDEPLNMLGAPGTWASAHNQTPFASATDMFNWITQQLNGGRVVVYSTSRTSSGYAIVSPHAYSVVSTLRDANGQLWMQLRNPWGTDGPVTQGANDGYIWVTAAQANWAFGHIASANA